MNLNDRNNIARARRAHLVSPFRAFRRDYRVMKSRGFRHKYSRDVGICPALFVPMRGSVVSAVPVDNNASLAYDGTYSRRAASNLQLVAGLS